MPLREKDIKRNKKKIAKLGDAIEKKSAMHYIASDPTRLRLIWLLKKNSEICVSELAEVLGITISAVSHQLRMMERYGIVGSQKMGKAVCYHLNNNFPLHIFNLK